MCSKQPSWNKLNSACALCLFTCIESGTAFGQSCALYADHEFEIPFATEVASLGDFVMVGQSSIYNLPGTVYVFASQDGKWESTQQLFPTPPGFAGDRFGRAIAMHGDTAVIGKPNNGLGGPSTPPGQAYVFRLIGNQWVQEAILMPDDGDAGDTFGGSVALFGDVAVVGRGNPAPGSYVFRRTGNTWAQEQKLEAVGSIAVADNVVIVGTPGPEVSTTPPGSAFVFSYNGVEWVPGPVLTASDASLNDKFGISVAIHSSTAIIGARWADGPVTNCGAAYIFTNVEGKWTQVQKLTASDPSQDYFGETVLINSDLIVVGAPRNEVPQLEPGTDQGSAYVFHFDGANWFQSHQIIGKTMTSNVGMSIAQSNGTIIAGSLLSGAFAYNTPLDCNENLIADGCDLPDCNLNSVPDDCESFGKNSDCDGDGVFDPCETPVDYVLDDGTWETYTGMVPGDIIWLNQFNVTQGSQIINAVEIAWTSKVPDHTPATLLIYSDPNNDGHPSDAVLLTSAETKTHAFGNQPGPATFTRELVPPTYVGDVGDSYFVGAYVQCLGPTHSDAWFPATLDATAPHQNRSWHVVNQLYQCDIKNLANNGIGQPQNMDFMIRAISFDCNENSVADQCDIDSGLSADTNSNGIPDECESSCVADLAPEKGNGVVNVDDLLKVINSWGVCAKTEPCEADVAPPGGGGDGQVNVDDLLFIINNWGPCV